MKKLFHLVLIASIIFSTTSCSKSVNDLVPEKKTASPEKKLVVNQSSKFGQMSPGIYNFITQPNETVLGDPATAVLYAGADEIAVFYVIIPSEYSEASIKSAVLTMVNDATGPVSRYDLMYMDRSSNYDVVVPEELINQSYMFAMVNLKDLRDPDGTVYNPNSNSVSLQANIKAEEGNLNLQLRHAFSYIQ